VSTAATTVSLQMQRQKMPEWCWAAVSVSVDLFFRPDSAHTQCEIAGAALNLQCCDSGKPADTAQCNAPNALAAVLGTLHLLVGDPLQKCLTFDEIQKEIDAGRPICVLIKWLDNTGKPGPRGHFIVIDGYRVTPAQKQFVSIADPLYGPSEMDYDQFASLQGGYHDGQGVWFATFFVQNEAKA
jgi:hypothetical protein